MVNVPAGWFPDESSPGRDRYWDGFRWTDETRDSVGGGPKPPAPQHGDPANNHQASGTLQLIDLSAEQFRNYIAGLADRENIHVALIAVHEVETELCQRVRDLERHIELKLYWGDFMTNLIAAFEGWYTHTRLPTIENLGVAMETDFNAAVKTAGGASMLPGSLDDAWENYVRPVKVIALQMETEVRPYLEAFARVQCQF